MLQRDNLKFRSIVSSYINSEELSDELFNIFNEFNDNAEDDEEDTLTSQLSQHSHNRGKVMDISKVHLKNLNKLDIEMSELLSQILKEEDRQRLLVEELMKLMEKNKEVFGVGRWTKGKYIVGDTAVTQTYDIGIQVDEKDSYGVVNDFREPPIESHASAPPVVPSNLQVRGFEVPYDLRGLMYSFPRVIRIPPAAWTCQMIMAIYFHKLRYDRECDRRGELHTPLPNFVHHYFSAYFGGQPALTDVQLMVFFKACEYHMTTVRRVALFASQLGLYDKNAKPSMDVRDTDFLLSVLETLEFHHMLSSNSSNNSSNSNMSNMLASPSSSVGAMTPYHSQNNNSTTTSASHKGSSKQNNVKPEGFTVALRPEVLRTVAVATVEQLLKKWMPDGGQDHIIKVKSMNGIERNSRYVNLDDFLEILMEPWTTIRLSWEDHARYLFHSNAHMYRVLSEAQFATDAGIKDRDAVAIQIAKLPVNEYYRRPLRLFQAQGEIGPEVDANESKKKGPAVPKEPVVELITRKQFTQVLRMILPDISLELVSH